MVNDDIFGEASRVFIGKAVALAAVSALEDEDAVRYNTLVDELDRLVEQWDDKKLTVGILRPLLADPTPAVRGAAAQYVLSRGLISDALAVLRELAAHPEYGDPADQAATVLEHHETVTGQ